MGRRLGAGRRISVLAATVLLGLAAMWSSGAFTQMGPLANPEAEAQLDDADVFVVKDASATGTAGQAHRLLDRRRQPRA
jgi:hypothetical protein